MRKYTQKYLVEGYRVGAQFAGKKLIAIPERSLKKWNGLRVCHGDKEMVVTPEMKPLSGRYQDDKFGRESFLLLYYEWQPGRTEHELKVYGEQEFVGFQHPLVNGGNPCKVPKEQLADWHAMAKKREDEEKVLSGLQNK